MAQQTLNNGISGMAFRKILNDNFSDLYTNKADKNHASTGTDFGVASTTNFGHIKVSIGGGLNVSGGVLSLTSATTEEAVAGEATNSVMSPARVKEAINAYSVVSDGNLILKVSPTQPTPQEGKTIIWLDSSGN